MLYWGTNVRVAPSYLQRFYVPIIRGYKISNRSNEEIFQTNTVLGQELGRGASAPEVGWALSS